MKKSLSPLQTWVGRKKARGDIGLKQELTKISYREKNSTWKLWEAIQSSQSGSTSFPFFENLRSGEFLKRPELNQFDWLSTWLRRKLKQIWVDENFGPSRLFSFSTSSDRNQGNYEFPCRPRRGQSWLTSGAWLLEVRLTGFGRRLKAWDGSTAYSQKLPRNN